MVNMTITLIMLLVFLIAGVGLVVLQIFLSKSNNKWLGLILPIITFCLSLIVVSSVFTFSFTSTNVQVMDENGIVLQEESTQPENQNSSSIVSLIMPFIMMNIPTTIYLAIYIGFRVKKKKMNSLQKMQTLDLE